MIEFFSCFIIILGIFFKRSKLITIVSILMAIVFIGGSTYNADYYSYENNYYAIGNGLKSWDFEFGFQALNKFVFSVGFSHQEFRFIIATLGLLLVYSTVKKYTKNTAYVMSLYLLYPLILDSIQIRNFLAMSMIIFGMRYVISVEKNYVKYIASIFVASAFHITSFFYLSILLIALKNRQRMITVITAVSILSTILMPVLIKLLSLILNVDKIKEYFLTETSVFTQIGVFSYFFFLIFIIMYIEKNYSKGIKSNSREIKDRMKNKEVITNSIIKIDGFSIYAINIIMLLTLPLVINNLNFIRLYRNIFILNYIYYSVYLDNHNKSYRTLLIHILVFISVLGSVVIFLYLVPQTDIIAPFFEYNIILNK